MSGKIDDPRDVFDGIPDGGDKVFDAIIEQAGDSDRNPPVEGERMAGIVDTADMHPSRMSQELRERAANAGKVNEAPKEVASSRFLMVDFINGLVPESKEFYDAIEAGYRHRKDVEDTNLRRGKWGVGFIENMVWDENMSRVGRVVFGILARIWTGAGASVITPDDELIALRRQHLKAMNTTDPIHVRPPKVGNEGRMIDSHPKMLEYWNSHVPQVNNQHIDADVTRFNQAVMDFGKKVVEYLKLHPDHYEQVARTLAIFMKDWNESFPDLETSSSNRAISHLRELYKKISEISETSEFPQNSEGVNSAILAKYFNGFMGKSFAEILPDDE